MPPIAYEAAPQILREFEDTSNLPEHLKNYIPASERRKSMSEKYNVRKLDCLRRKKKAWDLSEAKTPESWKKS